MKDDTKSSSRECQNAPPAEGIQDDILREAVESFSILTEENEKVRTECQTILYQLSRDEEELLGRRQEAEDEVSKLLKTGSELKNREAYAKNELDKMIKQCDEASKRKEKLQEMTEDLRQELELLDNEFIKVALFPAFFNLNREGCQYGKANARLEVLKTQKESLSSLVGAAALRGSDGSSETHQLEIQLGEARSQKTQLQQTIAALEAKGRSAQENQRDVTESVACSKRFVERVYNMITDGKGISRTVESKLKYIETYFLDASAGLESLPFSKA
eukprot:Trichotokara_eunicae@DN3405_c0_g1_i1.p1